MNSRPEIHLDKQAFLHWAEGQERRFELKGGLIVMMAGGTKGHGRIIQRIAGALLRRLDPVVWAIAAADVAVEIGEDIRYPDIVIEPLDGANSALATNTPTFVAEVVSPSSLALDFNVKAAEYMSLPSLEAYLVAAQDDMRMWLWQRPAEGQVRPFPKLPQELVGPAALLHICALDAQVPLDEIYRGIVAPRYTSGPCV
jgi:Uma2 family endonuclease